VRPSSVGHKSESWVEIFNDGNHGKGKSV